MEEPLALTFRGDGGDFIAGRRGDIFRGLYPSSGRPDGVICHGEVQVVIKTKVINFARRGPDKSGMRPINYFFGGKEPTRVNSVRYSQMTKCISADATTGDQSDVPLLTTLGSPSRSLDHPLGLNDPELRRCPELRPCRVLSSGASFPDPAFGLARLDRDKSGDCDDKAPPWSQSEMSLKMTNGFLWGSVGLWPPPQTIHRTYTTIHCRMAVPRGNHLRQSDPLELIPLPCRVPLRFYVCGRCPFVL